MQIPGTQIIDVEEVSPGNEQNELFCFCINELTDAAYLDKFIESLDEYLPRFVFSREVVDNHQRLIAEGKTTQTSIGKAREFLQKTKPDRTSDSGEFGEFLLNIFAKEVKGAHKLVSKIQSRGSTGATLPGRDGAFIWKDEAGEIYMLLGEAKTTPVSNDGLRDAQNDMNNFWGSGNIGHEVNLASTHLRSELTAENADMYETYFIDDNPNHANLKYKNLILVGYSFSALTQLIAGSTSLDDFKNLVCADLVNCFTNQNNLITASPQPSIYCFLPFESIDAARQAFAQHNFLTS